MNALLRESPGGFDIYQAHTLAVRVSNRDSCMFMFGYARVLPVAGAVEPPARNSRSHNSSKQVPHAAVTENTCIGCAADQYTYVSAQQHWYSRNSPSAVR